MAYGFPVIVIFTTAVLPASYEPQYSSSLSLFAWTHTWIKPYQEQILTAMIVSLMLSTMAATANDQTTPMQVGVAAIAILATIALNYSTAENDNIAVGIIATVCIVISPIGIILLKQYQREEQTSADPSSSETTTGEANTKPAEQDNHTEINRASSDPGE